MSQATRNLTVPDIVELETRHAAVVRITGRSADLPSLLGQAFEATTRQIAASGAHAAGPPFARYLSFGEHVEADVGVPYAGRLLASDLVHDAILPGGRAVVSTIVGPYETIADAWADLDEWIRDRGLERTGPPWESYLTAPSDPGEPVTQIVVPVR
jgi:effector-binding domain-containing protein